LRWRHADRKRGVITVATPRSQSLIGFVRGSGETTPHLASEPDHDFSVITLTALDDQPIATSRRLLLVATTGAAQNTGQKFQDDGTTLAEWGTGPVLIEPLTGTVTLRGLTGAKAVRAIALTPEGRSAGGGMDATRAADRWELELGKPASTWWQVEVER
jgi:hypothetical protein